MLSIYLRAAGIIALLIVGACNEPPWILDRTADAITLRWYTDETDSAAAQAHCQSSGKNAELISYAQNGGAQIGKYRCR